MSIVRVSKKIGSKELVFETGQLAKQANGAVVVRYGDCVVLVTACMSRSVSGEQDFFPLMVEYREKQYAAGRIPGGFFKREGRPSEREVLTARLIDRSIRPLFPEDLRNEVQIVAQVFSSDTEYDPAVFAMIGASAALTISDIPFNGPVASLFVASKNGENIIIPTYTEAESSDVDIYVSGLNDKVVMIESGCNEAPEEVVASAISFAVDNFKDVIALQDELKGKAGKPKFDYSACAVKKDDALIVQLKSKYLDKIKDAILIPDKDARMEQIDALCADIYSDFTERSEEVTLDGIKKAVSVIEKEIVRKMVADEGRRFDGRAFTEIRPVSCEVGFLPRTHGSSLFTRGQTQSLCTVTLGTRSDEQIIEGLEEESSKSFMLHYSFPPFSVGEVKPIRSPGRREIGHGALAERAIRPMMPEKDVFPYTVRVVSEILESNGSSSMATACAASLALMDAGVPLKEAVAGIAIGLIKEGEKYTLLTDIAGVEDHFGDMDFKVAGTKNGINAIQMDLKIDGIPMDVVKKALELARAARHQVLEIMDKVIAAPRTEISALAPRIAVIQLPQDKIKDVIGPMGKNIKKIIAQTESKIDIDDTGLATIAAPSKERLEEVKRLIDLIITDPVVGQTYDAVVTRILNFGAFCDIGFGKEGLVHISEIADEYVEDIESQLKIGDKVRVKLIKIDDLGRLNFSIKKADKA